MYRLVTSVLIVIVSSVSAVEMTVWGMNIQIEAILVLFGLLINSLQVERTDEKLRQLQIQDSDLACYVEYLEHGHLPRDEHIT